MRVVVKRENEQEEKNYEKMLIRHRRKGVIFAVLAVILIVAALFAVKIFQDKRVYETVETVKTIDVGDVQKCKFYGYGEGLLRYSNDGISYMIGEETVWNQAFEMKQPVVDICNNTMAIADLKGTTVYIYNTQGQQGKIEMTCPILDLEVSEQGVVAAISQNETTNIIEIYDKEGTNIAMGQTVLSGDGCPLDISLSADGTKLAVSYVYLESNVVRTKVVFYNYSEVGKNKVGRIVGGFEHYGDTIISKVEFVTNDIVAAFGDNVLTFYSIHQTPEILKEYPVDKEIKSILYNEKYIGLILKSATTANEYILKLYDINGKEILEKTTDFQYTEAQIRKKSIILNNQDSMQIISAEGIIKYEGNLNKDINKVISTFLENKFLVITNDVIEEIEMK